MKPQSPSKSKIQITSILRSREFIVITFSIVFILGVCGYIIFRKNFVMMPEKMNTYFTVVLDCGSTGSRVNVFEWMIGNGSSYVNVDLPLLLHSYPNDTNTKNGCRYHCMQTEPGLHNFVDNETGVKASLEPLFRYAEQWIPLDKRGTTPVFVLATAGVRRLENKNAARILEIVEDVVKEHNFLYKKDWIRVLSGKEEAYYGWVALNYKMGIFGSSSLRLSTLGLLDLGGSSLQVVAEVNGSSKDEHAFVSKIGVIEHDIVAYSLPHFGLNEAFDRTIVMLSHSEGIRELDSGIFEVRHPCLSSSFMKNYTCRGCFGVDSRVSRNLDSGVQEVFLVGDPNWEQCKVIARAVAVNSSDLDRLDQHQSDCVGLFSHGGDASLNLTKTLHSISRYHALSGFFAVYNALNLSQRANLTMLWESGKNLCSQSIHDPKRFIGQDCFRVPYLASLLENALCLNNNADIIFGPGDISWTLGASLIEGEFLWHRRAEVLESSIFAVRDNMIMSSPLVTFVLLLLLILAVYICQIKLPVVGRKSASRTSMWL